ncbi:unnamed protein product [Protopolystoma xenopodis]|uniref:Uncharacterized protein n=1 Tax=Protopolystoma xenopodis TaxID=117903 RepID=A0A3S5AJV6_9PLAT|nr:unnamed protein product [Protopolystoma xenopodis]
MAWRGLRDAELSAVTGLPGSVFVHSNGFIAIHAGREETLQMIIKTLSQQISSTTQE